MEVHSKPRAAGPAAGEGEDDDRAEVAIMWFRRDLRVDDNPALAAAQKFAKYVVSFRFSLFCHTHARAFFLSL